LQSILLPVYLVARIPEGVAASQAREASAERVLKPAIVDFARAGAFCSTLSHGIADAKLQAIKALSASFI